MARLLEPIWNKSFAPIWIGRIHTSLETPHSELTFPSLKLSAEEIAEFGDFQTPPELARQVCSLLVDAGVAPASVLEPTCGRGSFLLAALDRFESSNTCLGADINPNYIAEVEMAVRSRPDRKRIRLAVANFFAVDWQKVIAGLPKPVLILGNLPWVTNSQLSLLGSSNLPAKTNFQGRNGLDAITGKANFDISEWMLINLIEAMRERRGTLAMLCKSAVARKVLSHAWKHELALAGASVFRIEADLHFNAAVDAALLLVHFSPGTTEKAAKVYNSIDERVPESTIGYADDTMLADFSTYQRWKHLCGDEAIKWRSGIKHDCAKVMELIRDGRRYRNGMGELVELEDELVFPMMKSSHVAKGGKGASDRFMLVTQRSVGEDTATIRYRAPKTWAYLRAHAGLLSKRGSSIYRNRAPFSIFGVGDYSFAPWKVAISGFYKKIEFSVLGPIEGKPIVLDDTSYFLPCETNEQAEFLARLLNSEIARSFYKSFVFWDSKRPIIADLLRRLDLRHLAAELNSESTFNALFNDREGRGIKTKSREKERLGRGLFD